MNILEFIEVMKELETLGNERTKKIYMGNGAHEPLYGCTIKALNPLAKTIGKNQVLADELYETGNYDAMYLAGMIAEPEIMTAESFEKWMQKAYFYMISDFIVAVTLAETDIAESVADTWIKDSRELYISAGYSAYCWLLGVKPDSTFDKSKLKNMLHSVKTSINNAPDRAKYSMNSFVMTVGISFLPLHEEALITANEIGTVTIQKGKGCVNLTDAAEYIQAAKDKNKLGFKRKNVRC